MVAVGEGANDPAAALEKVGAMHRRDVVAAARTLTSVVEPLLVVAVGLVVGFIVFAMMLPILQIDITELQR
jgi:type II secretory pathway component PulF